MWNLYFSDSTLSRLRPIFRSLTETLINIVIINGHVRTIRTSVHLDAVLFTAVTVTDWCILQVWMILYSDCIVVLRDILLCDSVPQISFVHPKILSIIEKYLTWSLVVKFCCKNKILKEIPAIIYIIVFVKVESMTLYIRKFYRLRIMRKISLILSLSSWSCSPCSILFLSKIWTCYSTK